MHCGSPPARTASNRPRLRAFRHQCVSKQRVKTRQTVAKRVRKKNIRFFFSVKREGRARSEPRPPSASRKYERLRACKPLNARDSREAPPHPPTLLSCCCCLSSRQIASFLNETAPRNQQRAKQLFLLHAEETSSSLSGSSLCGSTVQGPYS